MFKNVIMFVILWRIVDAVWASELENDFVIINQQENHSHISPFNSLPYKMIDSVCPSNVFNEIEFIEDEIFDAVMVQRSTIKTYNDLPNEIILEILAYLNIYDLISISRVDKKFCKLMKLREEQAVYTHYELILTQPVLNYADVNKIALREHPMYTIDRFLIKEDEKKRQRALLLNNRNSMVIFQHQTIPFSPPDEIFFSNQVQQEDGLNNKNQPSQHKMNLLSMMQEINGYSGTSSFLKQTFPSSVGINKNSQCNHLMKFELPASHSNYELQD